MTVQILAPAALKNVLRAAEMAQRWGSLKRRVLDLKAEREDCDGTNEELDGGDVCRLKEEAAKGDDALFSGGPMLAFAAWCGPCQRNEARFLLRRLLERKLRDAGRRMLVLA